MNKQFTPIITISDIVEEKNGICDIKYKDMSLPPGLILENNNNIKDENVFELFPEENDDIIINEDLFNKLLHNEKRKRLHNKTRKVRPTKIVLTLKNKL